jgi:hypothetical protein
MSICNKYVITNQKMKMVITDAANAVSVPHEGQVGGGGNTRTHINNGQARRITKDVAGHSISNRLKYLASEFINANKASGIRIPQVAEIRLRRILTLLRIMLSSERETHNVDFTGSPKASPVQDRVRRRFR